MSKALATKNVAAVLLGIGLIASTFAFAVPANAQSVSDLNTQIQALMAQIAALQGGNGGSQQVGGLGCSTTFTQNLKLGSSGGEVKAVQKFLNSVDGAQIATTGAGSPGNETNYFGGLTKAAVIKFQDKFAADILTPVGLSKGTGNWFASTRAKANALCAAGPGPVVPGPGPVVPGAVMISGGVQPANSLAVATAARVPFTRFVLTNGSSAAVTVTGVVVERQGFAADANFSSIVLVDQSGQQVGNSKLLNTNHQATIGDTFTLQPGASMTYTVAGNMSSAANVNGGELASFAVVGVNTTATVSGSLPIVGATHTMNDTLALSDVSATYVTVPGADATKPVGTMGYGFSTVRLTAGSQEDITVQSIRWNQSGSAASSDLGNVIVTVDGVSYPATVSSDGKYYTAAFGNGIVISKGLSKEFAVKGDIVGGAGRTVAFDIYRVTDIYMVGNTYGYGLSIEDDNTTSSGAEGTFDDDTTPVFNGYDVTVAAGTVNSVSKSNTVPASNIAESVANTPLGAFEISLSGEPIQVQTMKFAIDISSADDGDDFTNMTLVNQNGVVLAGPTNGSATDYTPTGGTASEGSVSFSSVNLPVGTTVLIIKGQLSTDFDAADTVTIRVNPADWTAATGMTTGNSITLTSSEASANVQTIRAAALVAVDLTQPVARTIVKGVTDFVFAQTSLDTSNSGEDIRVTAVLVENTPTGASIAADIDNVEIWANLTGGTTNDSVRGDVFETMVADAEQFDETTAATADTISISLDNPIIVPKNSTIVIAVVADVSGSATGTATHVIDLNTVTASGVNTGSSASDTDVAGTGQAMTLSAGGTLTVSVDSSSPAAKLLLDNGTEQLVGVFRLAANNVEDLDLDKIKITDDGAADVVSSWVFKVGGVSIGSATTVSGTATLNLNDGTVTIPANDYKLVSVYAVLNNIDGTAVVDGDTVIATIAAATDVETTGKGSGTSIDSTQTSVDAATHIAYQTYPVFAFDNTGVSTVLTVQTNYLAGKIVVSNPGDKDIIFGADNEIVVGVQLAATSLTDATDVVFAQVDGVNIDVDLETGAATGSTSFTLGFDTNTMTIPAGGSKTIYVYFDTGGATTAGDTLQLWLSDAAATNVEYSISTAGAGNDVGTYVFKPDIYGPTHLSPL